MDRVLKGLTLFSRHNICYYQIWDIFYGDLNTHTCVHLKLFAEKMIQWSRVSQCSLYTCTWEKGTRHSKDLLLFISQCEALALPLSLSPLCSPARRCLHALQRAPTGPVFLFPLCTFSSHLMSLVAPSSSRREPQTVRDQVKRNNVRLSD